MDFKTTCSSECNCLGHTDQSRNFSGRIALANRAYLINSTSLTCDSLELERLRERPGHVDGVVAESANRLLVPWFLCFRSSDLRPVSCDFMQLQLPCVTVEQAVRNLEESLPVFEAIVGNAMLARPYWALSCALLRRLPLPYLTMDPIEVLQLGWGPVDVLTEHMASAFSGDLAAIPHLRFLTGYDQDVLPYPLEVLYSIPSGGSHEQRRWNASVLDGGFQPSFEYVHWNAVVGTDPPAPPPAAADSVFGELYDVPRLLNRWCSAADQSAAGAELKLLLGPTDLLQVSIYARSTLGAERLEVNATLHNLLDELARGRLVPWCEKYGFGWKGIHFSSPDWTRIQYGSH